MPNYAIINPFPMLLGKTGLPLNAGFVFIGEPDKDPETFPLPIFWNAAGTDPASQPLRTIGGYIARAGSPAEVFCQSEYSIRVRDPFGAQVFYAPHVAGGLAAFVSGLSGTGGAGQVGYDASATYPAGSIGKYLGSFTNFDRSMSYTGPFALKSLGDGYLSNGVWTGIGGNSLSFRTLISTPSGGADIDNQRATMIVASETSDGGNSEEQTLYIQTKIKTGFAATWATSTAYSVGTEVRNYTTNGVYRCTQAGTSASSGVGPNGKGAAIADGTVVWRWINDSAINSKASIYNEVQVVPGAGDSWAQANNIEVEPGVTARSVFNTELDLTNKCGVDSVPGGLDKYCLGMYLAGPNSSTAAIQVSGVQSDTFSALWGIKLDGQKLASRSVIGIDASGQNGIGFGLAAGGVFTPTFTDSVIKDGSNAVKGVTLEGNYDSAGLEINGTSPAAISLPGNFSTWLIFTSSPFKVLSNGALEAKSLKLQLASVGDYTTDAAAAAGGVAVGGVYRTGSALKIRVV